MEWIRKASAWVEAEGHLLPVRERLGEAVGSILYIGADHRELTQLHSDAAGLLESEPLYRSWDRGPAPVGAVMRRLSV